MKNIFESEILPYKPRSIPTEFSCLFFFLDSSVTVPWGKAHVKTTECLLALNLVWAELLDSSLQHSAIKTFLQLWIIYSPIFVQLPKHQWRPRRFQLFDVTSSQVAKEAIKHPIA